MPKLDHIQDSITKTDPTLSINMENSTQIDENPASSSNIPIVQEGRTAP